MDFDQHVHPVLDGGGLDLGQRGILERGDDQQDRVGAHPARFGHLPRVEDEILPEQR